jgi:hypothetical protein
MEMSKKDSKTEFGGVEVSRSKFPHGIEVRLGNAEMKKLGMEMPNVGDEMIVLGVGPVTHASENRRQGGIDRSVTIQLQSMEVGEVENKSAIAAVSKAVGKV